MVAMWLAALTLTAAPGLTAGGAMLLELAPEAGPLLLEGSAAGGCWRSVVELGPGAAEAGIAVQTDAALGRGWRLTLGGGFRLSDAAGEVLWADDYAPSLYYTPYTLEAVIEPGRIRVQMFDQRGELQSQSDWLEVPAAQTAAAGQLALLPGTRRARFYNWEQAAEPLSPLVPDAPNKLRLRHGEGTDWRVVGEGGVAGEWRWLTPEQQGLRQIAAVERSTAVNLGLGGAEGSWRCRVKVDPGAGGAGLLFAVDSELQRGFNCWLGGTWGNGGLMLYRLPMTALWSSPQGVWRYDTEYQLEATIAGDQVRVRLLSADGAELAASPPFELLPEERGRAGGLGFMIWHGTGTFWEFGQAASSAAPESTLGDGWRAVAGEWSRDGDLRVAGEGTALHLATEGVQGVWTTEVEAGEGTGSVSLLFQAAPSLAAGFACTLGDELRLESLDGRVLWHSDALRLEPGRVYRFEGIVVTDRVQIRVGDATGAVLAESTQVYVSDTNNTRRGVLGFRATGPARFAEWGHEPGG